MSDQQVRLFDRANAEYGAICPCRGRSRWDECFTRENCLLIFWFNTRDCSTHVEMEDTK